MERVFIVTGEASGDAVGAGVARHIAGLRPETALEGIGSGRMAEAGVQLFANSRSWASIGIVQAIPQAPKLLALLGRLKRHLEANPPEVLVLVDFGAFNTRLGSWAVKRGIRTVYLMPPGSWRKDPGPKRLEALRHAADLYLSPFAWNAENLTKAGANAIHIGHPVLELAKPTAGAAKLAGELRPRQGRLIALLPGSRRHEVETLVPKMVAVASEWPHPDDRFVLVQAPSFTGAEFDSVIRRRLPAGVSRAQLDGLMGGPASRLSIMAGGNADAFWISDAAIVCAGTATLEGAVARRPMVVVYDGPWLMRLEWRLRRKGLKAPMVAMPNIIAGHRIVPELLGDGASVPNMVKAIKAFVDDPAAAETAISQLDEVRAGLGPEGALSTAAAAIIQAGGLK